MIQPLQEKKPEKSRILIAPLDWGLGHATRCIPVINELLKQNFDVWLAGEEPQASLLQKEFPNLPFLALPGYRIRYARSGAGLLWRVIQQIPQLIQTINQEHQWLKKMVKKYDFDAVISDNRYGLYNKKIFCVFITHQLLIKTIGSKWIEKFIQKINYHYINHFTECWLPDNESENNLAGILSHPYKKPAVPVRYIGWLSRLEKKNITEQKNNLLILLSGPEPQRSIFENIIVKQIAYFNGSAVILRGLPASSSMIPSTNTIRFYNHMTTEELNKEMGKAEFIIARSGYSSVMDIVKLQKKSILIPTPGQTEQLYLGNYLSQKQIAICIAQKQFSLEEALTKANNFFYHFPVANEENKFKEAIENLAILLK